MQFLGEEEGVEIIHFCDVPGRTGLGSSSSFIVGLLKGLHSLNGTNISPKNLAKQAIKIERGMLGEPGGIADQIYCSTNTGLSVIEIEKSGDFQVKPISVSRDFADYVSSCLTLVYIGSGRQAFKISESLDLPTTEETKQEYKRIAIAAQEEFEKSNLFGRGGIADLLEETWVLKRGISPLVSNDKVEDCYQTCKKYGAKAFKLLGAGSSGFAVALVRPEEMRYFKESVGYKCIDFGFDYEGSKVIFDSHERRDY